MLDVDAIRRDFPILARTVGEKRLVYLDSAASSQKPECVLGAVERYYRWHNANVHRGVYALAEEATELYEQARGTLAAFLGGCPPEEVVFTRNATEGLNLIAYAWGRANVAAGDVIVLTPMEHHSNMVPWQLLAAETGAALAYVDLLPDGTLSLESLGRMLECGRVKLVTVSYVSNVLGTINPISEIAYMSHRAGATLLVDAAQAAPHLPLDVPRLGADFLALTGHKMLGPMGIGALWGRAGLLEAMPPFMGGGEMIRRVTEDGATWNDIPWKFEAGTPNVGGAVGLAAAIDYLSVVGMDAVREHECELTRYALERLAALPGVVVYGPADAERRGGVVSFSVEGIHPHDLATIADRDGVCIRAGHHCAQPLMARLGVGATSRASFYLYNDTEDVDALCAAITMAQDVMKVEEPGRPVAAPA